MESLLSILYIVNLMPFLLEANMWCTMSIDSAKHYSLSCWHFWTPLIPAVNDSQVAATTVLAACWKCRVISASGATGTIRALICNTKQKPSGARLRTACNTASKLHI